MIQVSIAITLIIFILLFVLQGKYIVKLKQHIRFNHKELHKELKLKWQPTLYGPLMGLGRSQKKLIKEYGNQNNDPVIKELSLIINNYCTYANIAVALCIALVALNAFY